MRAARLLDERRGLHPVRSSMSKLRPALPLARNARSWRLAKSKRAGEVGYHLFEKNAPGEAK